MKATFKGQHIIMNKNLGQIAPYVGFILTLVIVSCSEPEYTNQVNGDGQRDGYWKLYLDNDYEPTPLEAFAPFYALLEYDDGEIDSDVTILYRTGELYWHGNLLSFIPFRVGDGLHEFYHRNGTLKSKLSLKDNKLDGEGIEWFESGSMKYSCSYFHGLKNGVETEWAIEGFKSKEVHWDMGRKTGTETTWFSDGKKSSLTEWQNDVLHGRKLFYDQGFMISENYSYGNLNGLREEYWPTGELRVTTSFRDGRKHGPETGYYHDGQKKSVINWENGIEDGVCRTWHPNGAIEGEWTYTKGKQDGRQIAWDSLGNITRISQWDNDNFLGVTYQQSE